MKRKIFFSALLSIAISSKASAQLELYDSIVTQYLTSPPESGFMLMQTPNTFTQGALFQVYKNYTGDIDNDMTIVRTHTDNLVNMTHHKYKQTYKGVDVEAAGCIEHFLPNGSLAFVNAKLAVNLDMEVKPDLTPENAVTTLLSQLSTEIQFAWNDSTYEADFQQTMNDPNATYYPTAKLVLAIDSYKDVLAEIPANRYQLAYKIKVVSIDPFQITEYYIDASTGTVFKERITGVHENGIAGAYGYGTNNAIDSKWVGGFAWEYRLHALDNGHNYETRKDVSQSISPTWGGLAEVDDSDDDWGNVQLTETSAHVFTGLAWDYFSASPYNRDGIDDNSKFLQVRTQRQAIGAWFHFDFEFIPNPRLTFGKVGAWDYSWDPSIVAHEYFHGIVEYTANLAPQFEPGALEESYADIFGLVIQAEMLDNGVTDWIFGNHASGLTSSSSRSLVDPNSAGDHIAGTGNGPFSIVYGGGQPDTYLGTYYYSGTSSSIDEGGIHVNSGVQNHWFYILAHGASGTNDINDYYNVPGIGMDDAARIAYLAVTSNLLSASQYTDSRMATIQAATYLFGACSQQYRSTVDAWYAVGLGSLNSCAPLAISDNSPTIQIYPNPSKGVISISLEGTALKNNINIYSLTGQLVKSVSPAGLNTLTVSDLSAGTYFIHLESDNESIIKKVIIL